MQSHSDLLGVRTSTYDFVPGDKIQPITHNIKGHAGKNT